MARKIVRRMGAFYIKALRYMAAVGLLGAGVISLVTVAYDYMPTIAPIFPIQLDTYATIEAAQIQGLVDIVKTSMGISIGVAIAALVLSFLLLVQDPLGTVRNSPRMVLRSPVSTYRSLCRTRDWVVTKIEYLETESKKWKTLFNVVKAPYSILRACGLSPQMASILLAGSTVAGGGVVVNETILAERSFKAGDSGIYAAPSDVPTTYTEGDNTLRIKLGSTAVRESKIENVSVGTVFTGSALPTGQTTAILVGGVDVTEGTDTVLEIGELIIEKSRCKSMDFSNINAHTINVIGNASDGQSINTSPGSSTSTNRMRAIGGGHHQAAALVTSGGTYDRIHIDAPTSAVNGKIHKLHLSNLFTSGGPCTFERMNLGTLTIQFNEIGNGDGFATKEFSIAESVTAANWNVTDNVEVTIAQPTAQ